MAKEPYYKQFMNLFSCKSLWSPTDDIQGCYIMTLGVIDECRQLGLGTSLL